MNYSIDEVIEYVTDEDVKFVRLAFCDLRGRQKNVAVMPTELMNAMRFGMKVNASGIDGFAGEILLKPDPATLTELPWRPQHGRVAHLFCDVCELNGKLMASYPRNRLKYRNKGGEVVLDETFYLLLPDENGRPTAVPHDRAGYLDIAPEDKGENVRREICLTLERMGIRPLSSHHERGPAQHIVNYAAASPVEAADNAVTYRAVVRTIAAQYGLCADFSPEPIRGEAKNVATLTVDNRRIVLPDTDEDPYLMILKNL